MSVTGKRGVGIPIVLLHDAEGGIVTVELKNGNVYRGILDDAQDNMNCTIKVLNHILISRPITFKFKIFTRRLLLIDNTMNILIFN